MTKKCYECQQTKSAEAFYKDNSHPTGLSGYCRSCKNLKARTKWSTDEAYRQQMLVNRKAWGEAHKEELQQYLRQWQLDSPDKVCEYSQKRRALLAAVFVEHVSRRLVWERDDGCCRICKGLVPFEAMHLDHIVPISKGGKHSYVNVQTSCEPCNLSKGAKILEEVF